MEMWWQVVCGIVDVGWGFNGISRVREGISTLYTIWIINRLHRSRRRCGLVVAGKDKLGYLETPNSRQRVVGSVKARKGARQTSELDHWSASPQPGPSKGTLSRRHGE